MIPRIKYEDLCVCFSIKITVLKAILIWHQGKYQNFSFLIHFLLRVGMIK